jgi:hypothetical protein
MMGLYAEGLFNQLTNGELKNAKEVLAKIKGLVVCWPNSEKLAIVYAQGLSFIGQVVRGKHALKYLDEIGMLTKYWKSDDILLEYALLEIHLEVDLTISNDLEYNLYVINHIENCLTYWPNSTRILELYGRNLVSLANKQEDNEATHTVNILGELFKTNPDNVLIAIMYTAGLFNRLVKSKGDKSDLFKMMSEVKNKWPLNNDIQTLYNYAKSILNTKLVSEAARSDIEQQFK